MRKTKLGRTAAASVAAMSLAALAITGTVLPADAAGKSADKPESVRPLDMQLLAINDFHGNLEPPSGSSGRTQVGVDELGGAINVNSGGVAYLNTVLDELRAKNPGKTLTVAAGDLIGASPLLSAAFHDEPTIEALSIAGLDYASVGNHEFDEGAAELLRMQNGGCHPVDGCADGDGFDGAAFQYLSANAFRTSTGEPLMAPYAVREVDGEKIGFIGMTLEGTKEIVSQEGVAGLEFADEVETANKYAAELQAQGVEAIVVLLHQGGSQTGAQKWDVNACDGLSGPIVDIAEGMSDAIDVVVSGHTHQAYNCEIDEKLVTSASSFGRLVTDIDLRINRVTGDIIRAKAENVVVTRDRAEDGDQLDLIARYREALGPIANEIVGHATEDILKSQETLYQIGVKDGKPVYLGGESPMGNLIADAQLAASDDEYGAVAAFMNPGGVRGDLLAGEITYEEAFTVQPFTNNLVTLDLTGEQLYCMLEQQFVTNKVLQPSSTVSYVVDPAGTTGTAADPCSGSHVVDGSLYIGDSQVAEDATVYRVTVNNFLSGGGDGFSVLTGGTNAVTGPIDVDAFTDYLTANDPVSAPATDRIVTTEEAAAQNAA